LECVFKTVSGIELQFIELQLFGKENNNFQSDWNSTIINKPDLTVYALPQLLIQEYKQLDRV
jgi:hypothetical protein